jgi:8-oxo-dGTP diphosphatase
MFEDSDHPVRVAAGVLKKDGTVLLCQRGINHRYGLRWEFPGGKIYPGEPLTECLTRELWEELGIEPLKFSEIKTLLANYSDGGKFLITFFLVSEYEGEVTNKVFESVRWVPVNELETLDILEGSRPILQYL